MSRQLLSEDAPKFELLADLGTMIAREVDLDRLLDLFAERAARAMNADRATLWLIDGATGQLRSRVANLPEVKELRLALGHGVAGRVAETGEIINLRAAANDPRWARETDAQTGYSTSSMLTVPVAGRGHLRGVIQLLNKKDGVFDEHDEDFARTLADQIGRALDYTSLRGSDVEPGVIVSGPFNHVVGSSSSMHKVYGLVDRAAATDATVLLTGETGTGKGLIARAIHVNSDRRAGPFVHVDCTTLPSGLVESELFGHERGAYTGADARVIGKVEAAQGGTLFLDEISELPLPLQGKLLRFVQERTFERVGGRDTLTADVRIISASNRDLGALVRSGQFRSDLFFRVRVVEICLPTLASRGDADIVALAEHFASQYARRYRRDSMRFAPTARAALLRHGWPGNVRELEHAIERAVVLSDDRIIDAIELGLDPHVAATPREPTPSSAPAPLAEIERRYAHEVVAQCGGNQSAAAKILGISRNKLARLLRRPGD